MYFKIRGKSNKEVAGSRRGEVVRADEWRGADGGRARREFLLSLCLLGFVGTWALGVLALGGNWRKFARVGIGFLTYVGVLLAWPRVDGRGAGGGRPGFPAFACAGACAELASGWLRPGVPAGLTLHLAPLAGLLIGGLHHLALRARRPPRERITRRALGQ